MAEKIIKLGVLGLGRGRDLGNAAMSLNNVKLVAGCDWNPTILENAREFYTEKGYTDVQYYDRFEDMLANADIDAVIIATDAVCHVPCVIQAMNAGKHVLSEIPTVNSIEEAKELKECVRAHPELKYMAAENCCYWAFIETWKKMFEEGQFGEVVYAEAEYLHARERSTFAPDNYTPGHWRTYNPAIKYLTHSLGPLLYIMNDRCVSVTCMEPDVKYNPYFQDRPENGVALFKTAKGAVIRILICFGAYVGFNHNYRLMGTHGTIDTDIVKPLHTAHSFASLSTSPETFENKLEIPVTLSNPGADTNGHGGADPRMIADFVDCIINDTDPPLDVDMGIRISLPGIIAHESAVNGGTAMEIPEL